MMIRTFEALDRSNITSLLVKGETFHKKKIKLQQFTFTTSFDLSKPHSASLVDKENTRPSCYDIVQVL